MHKVLECMTNICLKEKRVLSNLITITNVICRYKDIVILINIPLKAIKTALNFEKHTWKQI